MFTGYYCPGANEIVETPCPAGTECPSTEMSAPIDCVAGKYQDLQGQQSCKLCTAGHKCLFTGLTSPTDCGAGYYQDLTGQSACNTCTSGELRSQVVCLVTLTLWRCGLVLPYC